MYLYKYPLIQSVILLSILLVISSCVKEITSSPEDPLILDWVLIDYDQINQKLFIGLNLKPGPEEINDVSVNITADTFPIDTTITLLDDGINGDLISQNNIYSAEVDMELNYQNYQFIVFVNNLVVENTDPQIITIEEQFPPEIVNITFTKINLDGSETPLDPTTDVFQVDEDEYSFLYFSIEVKDLNGIEDLRYVRYQINVEGMEANDSCDYVAPAGFQKYHQWFLEYQSTTDSTYIFDVINDLLVDENNDPVPGLPIRPLSLCGRKGESAFQFIVADMLFSPVTSQPVYLVFE